MRLLFVGDVVGRSGRAAVTERLPGLERDWKLDCVIVNGENAAGGFGITEPIYNEMIDAGADAITGGNHSWDQREALVFIERAPRLIRPLNYPPGTPGRGMALVDAAQRRARAGDQRDGPRVHGPARRSVRGDRARAHRLSAQGRGRRDRDRHALRGDEREAGDGHFCDGRASLVVGTHTHAPTADHRVLPGGTAFISDVGMTGDYDSVIGMNKAEPLQRFVRRIPSGKFEPASGPATLCARRGRDRRRDRACDAHRAGAARRAAARGAAGLLGIDFFPVADL